MCQTIPPRCEGEDRRKMTSPEDCPYLVEAARMAVRETFAILGVNVDNPKEVDEFRKDWHFAHSQREDSKSRNDAIRNAVIAIVAVAVCGLLWVGFAHKIKEHEESQQSVPETHIPSLGDMQ